MVVSRVDGACNPKGMGLGHCWLKVEGQQQETRMVESLMALRASAAWDLSLTITLKAAIVREQ
eukprot:772857-Amphidinium_carterae.1